MLVWYSHSFWFIRSSNSRWLISYSVSKNSLALFSQASAIMQSTSHQSPWQSCNPHEGEGELHSLSLRLDPSVHEELHGDQADHLPQVPWHFCDSESGPTQGFPLLAGLGESQFLVLPVLHDLLHEDQADHCPHLPFTTTNMILTHPPEVRKKISQTVTSDSEYTVWLIFFRT